MNLTSKRAFMALLVVFLLILSLPTSNPLVSAQEATEEPTASATDEPISSTEPPLGEQATEVTPQEEVTEVSSEVPTEVLEPTLEPEITVEATEIVEATETVEATDSVEVITPEATTAPAVTSFTDDFEAFDGSGWILSGWQPVVGSDNTYLSSVLPSASALIDGFNEANFELNTTMRVALNNTATIAFRSGSESYYASFNSAGSSRLYRGTELLDFYTIPAAPDSEPMWFSVQIVAANDTISISVNGIPGIVYTDAAPLGSGQIAFVTGDTNTGEVSIDNVVLNVVDPAAVVFPIEATPFPTSEAEATAEVTPEVTPEATAEVTAEVTPELDPQEIAFAKMSLSLRRSIGGAADTQQLIDNLHAYNFAFDENGLVILEIVVNSSIEEDEFRTMMADFGVVDYGYGKHDLLGGVVANRIMDIALDERVITIRRPALAISTSSSESGAEDPAGTIATNAYDILGVQDWHNAGFTGAGVKIGVIDAGFSGSMSGAEYTCFNSIPLTTGLVSHGRNLIEVICDIAPDADVYALRAFSYNGFRDAVQTAMNLQLDILVIGLDLTAIASPGDGTGRDSSGTDPDDAYYQLKAARDSGMIILASAGNNGINDPAVYSGTDSRVSLYTAFNFSSVTPDDTVTVTMEVSAGDEIFVSWSDWNGLGANNFANGTIPDFEDFDFQMLKNGVPIEDPDEGPVLEARRQRHTDLPSVDLEIIPANCTIAEVTCTIELVITRRRGDAAVDFQVQLNPVTASGEPDRVVYIAGVSGATPFASGTLARPADSPDVIAVGAACANEAGNFALLPFSSVGPIFGANGTQPTYPTANGGTTIPYARDEVLPHVVSFSHVNTTLLSVANITACNGTISGSHSADGFDGTSAAVAHVGGMAALLLSNPTMRAQLDTNSAGTLDAVLDYLQTHSAELPLGNGANSFDFDYGAGLALLGSPAYNLNNTQNIASAPEQLPATCTGATYYVGQAQVDGDQNGSLAAPYTSLAFAIQQATATDCIIVMPGEYVTPLLIPSGKNGIGLYSYNSVTGTPYPASIIRVVGQYDNGTYQMATGYTAAGPIVVQKNFDNNAGVYLDNASNITINGFYFVPSATSSLAIFATNSLHQGLVAFNSDGLILSNNIFGAGSADGSAYNGWRDGDTTPVLLFSSDNARLERNTFRGNTAGFTSAAQMAFPSVAIVDSGVIGSTTLLLDNSFQNNTATAVGSISDLWPSVVFGSNSAVDMIANDFNGNIAATIVSAQTLNAGSTTFPLRIVSNLFINNTTSTSGPTAGPLIHGYYVPNISVINNTFANNDLGDSDSVSGADYSSIVGRGNRLNNGFGSLGSNVSLDFFNNLAYSNLMTQGVMSDPSTSLTGCNDLAGGGAATVRNWWFSSGSFPAACSAAMVANGNDTTNTPANDFIGVAITSLTQNQVNYWGLRQINTTTYSRGIDYSNVTAGSDVDLSAAPFNRDINDKVRITDVPDWELGAATPGAGTFNVDVGAFEFNKLDIVVPILVQPRIEDNGNPGANTSPIVIDLNQAVTGGFGQISFSLTQLPDLYGTQCGAAYTDTNHGSVLGQGVNNGKLFYCPPQHFYTDPAATDVNWPDFIGFEYLVIDETAAQDTGDVQLTLSPIADTALDAPPTITLGDEDPETDIFRVTGNVGTTVSVALRPFVAFTNGYVVSEFLNLEFNNSAANIFRMDYPFTYSNFNIVENGDGIIESPADVVLSGSNLNITLSQNNTGSATIDYTVTDANGKMMLARLLVRAVSRIPVDVGTYDDASFVFDYRDAAGNTEGNWTALFNTTAINNTLHRTNLVNDTATFGFKNNSGFILYMQGQGAYGGPFDIRIDVDSDGDFETSESLNGNGSAWSLIPGSTTVYQVTVGPFLCTSTAVAGAPPNRKLTSVVAGFYTITCNNDAHVNPATYLVRVTNSTAGKMIAIDAFAIIDDTDTANGPLTVGYHDATSAEVRGIFSSLDGWQEYRLAALSNGIAMRTLSANPSDLSFYVTGGPGFAVETALLPVAVTYTICVRDDTSSGPNPNFNQRTCQDFTNKPDATTATRYRAFRPFYGLDPNHTYEVTIEDISIAATGQFIIDSIVVFDPPTTPELVVEGVVEADELDYFVYGGGVEESWRLNLRDTTATQQSSITLSPGIIGAGPYIAFETDLNVTSIYYTYNEALISQQAMICVDRGAGAGTEAGNDDYGNCIQVNLLTGTYSRINADGTTTVGTENLKVATGTIRFVDDNDPNTYFSRQWEGSDTTGTSDPDVHIIEIFSLHDKRLSLDRVVALGAGVPLSAGRYEEYTENFSYLIPDGLGGYNPATIGTNSTTTISAYTGDFTQVTGAGATYDSSRGIMYTKEVGNVITFEINGTGFAPMIRYARDGGAMNICWEPYTAPTIPAAEDILATTTGACQLYDTESLRVGRNVPLPIMGLPLGTYAVAIEFLGDNFNTLNTLPTSVLWFDGVTVYDDDLPARLTGLDRDVTFEGNFNTRFTANRFAYFGNTWRYLSSPTYATYSNRDYDTITEGGATVAFQTSSANTVILDRPLRTGNAPLLICAQEIGVGVLMNRHCGIVDPTGVGNRNEFTFELTNAVTPPDYIVTITDLDGGAFVFDAVRTTRTTAPLTAGVYDDDNPAFIYDRYAMNLVLNGNMERNELITNVNDDREYWTTTGTAVSDRYATLRYRNGFSRRVTANGGGGIESLPFSLVNGHSYNFVAYVYIPSATGGTVTIDVETSDGVSSVFTANVTETNKWVAVHSNFVQTGDLADVVVRFTGSSGSIFYVDDVEISEGSTWQAIGSAAYYGGFATFNKSRGAEVAFSFIGTGFALGVPSSPTTGGEMRVCWLAGGGTNADIINGGDCMTYQQQTAILNNNNIRVVTGLPVDPITGLPLPYGVVITDIEDGRMNSATPALVGTARNPLYGVGTISLDWVEIFNQEPPVITSGVYSESATVFTGERALLLQPASRWNTFSGPTLTTFSDLSYIGAVNTLKVLDNLASGPAASVNLNIQDGQSATVIFDVAAAMATASNQLLACVGAPDGELVVDTVAKAYVLQDLDGTQECAILPSLRTSRYITLNSDVLPLLANSTGFDEVRTLTISTLTNGMFRIDDFQVIDSSILGAGYYEENIGTSLLVPSDASAWTKPNVAAYSGGSALETISTTPQTLTFQFNGTGVSVVTAFLTNGGFINLNVTDGGAIDIDETLDTRKSVARYGTSLSVAGLPFGTYTATITVTNGTGEKTAIDAIQVYDALPQLGSLYDDADVSASGTPLIAYGPNNKSWVVLTGATLAPNALNRTLHSGNLRGAVAAFEIGANPAKRASGIVLYYHDNTTAATVEVCFRDVANIAPVDCDTVSVNDDLDKETVTADAGLGNYYVTIENISDTGNFVFDAVQVIENQFSEGIYDAAYIKTAVPTATLVGTNIEIAAGDIISLNVDADMVGFAFVLQHAAGTSINYDVRIYDAGTATCSTSPTPATACLEYEQWPVTGSTVPATGTSALTYVGLHDITGDATYTVQLRNIGTGVLRFSHFHVMGDDDNPPTEFDPLLIFDKERHENDDPQIRYLPFGSWIAEINKAGDASEQSQHISQMQGAMVYFEFDDDTGENIGFEFARQVALTGYSNAEVCFGRSGIDTLFDVRSTNCTTIANNTTTAYRATVNTTTPSPDYCGTAGCWGSIRTLGTLRNTFDFIRLFDAANPLLQAGYYENNSDGLEFIDNAGTWQTNVTSAGASGGAVAKVSVNDDTALRDENGPVVSFLMEGTGFTAYFTANTLADEVKICAIPFTGTETAANALDNGICQRFDNQSATVIYKVARRVLGLPDGQYRVAIQMMADNGTPALHAATAANITMELDAIEIHNTDWLATNDLAAGRRIETHYRNRTIDNNFAYVGTGWTTLEASTLTTYSGRNYDLVRQHGAGIVFLTSADAVTLYANGYVGYAPFRFCVTPTANVMATRCQDYRHMSAAAGVQEPFTFQFADFGIEPATENVVTILTLTNQPAYFDALEVFEVYDDTGNVPLPLAAGTYDSTHAQVYFDNNYQQFVVNGNMDRNLLWTTEGSPTTISNTLNARYQGTLGYYIDAGASTGNGIESHGFELPYGGRYTLVAHVRVRSGTVRVRLVEGEDSTTSIPEFTSATVNVSPSGLIWQTVRVDFTLPTLLYAGYGQLSTEGLRVQIVSTASGTKFDVDDVSVSYGGLWVGEYAAAYTNRNTWASKSHGASFNFAFEGTGFELGTAANVQAGEMEVCYTTQTSYMANIPTGNGFLAAECFTYQQESAISTANARRAVTGLPFNIYFVRVRDVEDGNSNIVAGKASAPRNALYSVAKIAVDYVRIYDDTFVDDSIEAALADSLPDAAYYTVPPGFYDEDAINAVTGEQFLRLSPAENWKLIEGTLAAAYSGQSYYAAIDALGRADSISAGQAATLYVDVPASGATVILNTGIAAAANSNQLLICAGNALTGDGFGGKIVWSGTLYSVTSSTECVLRDIRLNSVAVVTGNDLAALNGSNPGPKRVMFTTVGRGLFYIDSYQVIYGRTLTPGVYDNALPDNLLNFNNSASTNSAVNTITAVCTLVQLDSDWCVRKSTTTYGRSAVVTQNLDATLNFNIQGTGFSVLTSVGALGVDFTICYGKTLPSGNAPNFPSRTSIVNSSRNLIWPNATQNLDQGGIYCDVLTSNSTRWATRFPDRFLPAGTQYGFSYYGLPDGNYSVQVRMIDNTLTALSTQVLEIDAVVVFSDYTDLPTMFSAFYDSVEAPISYEGAPFWQTMNYAASFPSGAYGRSERMTKYAGAIAQMQVDGNAITLYQTMNTNRSRDVRICLLISYATIHCTQSSDTTNLGITHPASPAPYALAVDMAQFSQSAGAVSYFTPIMFYGLGEGEHQLIFENRDHNRFMGIDAILVHD